MPMASALSTAIIFVETRRARAIGKPRKIVKPAMAPSSTVVRKSSGLPPDDDTFIAGIIAARIDPNVFGVPA